MKKKKFVALASALLMLSSTFVGEALEADSEFSWFKVHNVISVDEASAIKDYWGNPSAVYHCLAPVKIEITTDDLLDIGATQKMLSGGKLTSPAIEYYVEGFYNGCQKGSYFTIEKPGIYYLSGGSRDLLLTGMNLIVKGNAHPTVSKVYVDGKEVAFDAYNIGDNNYFKLRDIAMALKGTSKEFNVEWDEEKSSISLAKNTPYKTVGGELAGTSATTSEAIPNLSSTYLDGEAYGFVSYTINDNNYFMLRNLGEAFGFDVEWDGTTNSIHINTNN